MRDEEGQQYEYNKASEEDRGSRELSAPTLLHVLVHAVRKGKKFHTFTHLIDDEIGRRGTTLVVASRWHCGRVKLLIVGWVGSAVLSGVWGVGARKRTDRFSSACWRVGVPSCRTFDGLSGRLSCFYRSFGRSAILTYEYEPHDQNMKQKHHHTPLCLQSCCIVVFDRKVICISTTAPWARADR